MASCWSRSLADTRVRTSPAPSDVQDDGWRFRNPGRLLFDAADRFEADKLALVRADGRPLSDPQAQLFQYLDRDGTRLTMLAARIGIAKQSMIELVARAEALGLVDRRPDPEDGRAKIVGFTPDGLRLLDRLHAGVIGAERTMAQMVGKPFLARLKRQLTTYVAAREQRGASVQSLQMSLANPAWRRWSVGRMLPAAARVFADDTLAVVQPGGFPDVSAPVLALCRLLDRGGTRLTDLAARARLTKPAMAEIVDRATKLGLVERRDDPRDGRAKTILFTTQGIVLLAGARAGVAEAQRHMARVTGDAFVAEMVERLAAYAATTTSAARR